MSNGIAITAFRGINPVKSGKLCGFVDVEFNGVLVVKGFKVIDGKNGMFVAAPSREVKEEKGKYNDVVYFTKESELWPNMQKQILQAYYDHVNGSSGSVDI